RFPVPGVLKICARNVLPKSAFGKTDARQVCLSTPVIDIGKEARKFLIREKVGQRSETVRAIRVRCDLSVVAVPNKIEAELDDMVPFLETHVVIDLKICKPEVGSRKTADPSRKCCEARHRQGGGIAPREYSQTRIRCCRVVAGRGIEG